MVERLKVMIQILSAESDRVTLTMFAGETIKVYGMVNSLDFGSLRDRLHGPVCRAVVGAVTAHVPSATAFSKHAC